MLNMGEVMKSCEKERRRKNEELRNQNEESITNNE